MKPLQNEHTDPTPFTLRPRFEVFSNLDVEGLSRKCKVALESKKCPFAGKVRYGFVSIFPKEEDRHYWSPHLSVIIEENEESVEDTVARCHFGPSPAAWTLFIFLYAIIGLLILIVSVIGFANLSIGDSGMILYCLPILILALCSLYAVSFFGQKNGHDQMEAIDRFFMHIITSESDSQ